VDVATTQQTQQEFAPVDYQTDPSKYKHWRIAYDAPWRR
jgi:hypothetical protein